MFLVRNVREQLISLDTKAEREVLYLFYDQVKIYIKF